MEVQSQSKSLKYYEETKDSKVSIQSGYDCGDYNLSERFNANNKEMNKKRFMEANANIFKSK